MGLGDVLLAGAGGLWVGTDAIAGMVLLAAASALLVALLGRLRGEEAGRMVFGPYLAFGIWICFLLGT